ncbi:CDK-activating kinase assembly factor MAT1-domain-containing protein [Hypoxylon rubiginosum]|uniref:CDK-activating kinase assembly factor MAT1-domain-containing protein n=1 Tax=Hypoxylon rubiginosum TaxID=110542 RepID=A0ACC0CQ90_9PEZI|nr:CDK-activating kinase assembly factor MAT1-domain-containing protein [Hypoxylon rubiginosum]
MSRRLATGAATRTTATETLLEIPANSCPVCKRNRYLNPDLTFLINPECYHPMCSNCVTNIFSKGPAQCPYATCGKTLRQRGFRSAFFKDLTVEREVDIRQRVQAVFNMTQDDFETLRDYNDYLQQVEDLTFDLVQGGEAERRKAEGELLAYEQKHREEIEKNKKRGREAESQRKQRDAATAEAARQRRLEEQREEERARAEEKTINAEVMEALARGEPGSAAEITERIVAQKRAKVAEIAGSHFPSLLNSSTTTTSSLLSIRGLKDRSAPREDDDYYLKPYDAFAGLDLHPTRYELRGADAYSHPWLEDARTRDDHRVPGYSTHEYVARALFDAFAGLGVAVADDKADAQRAAGTVGAETAAATGRTGGMGLKMEVEDVFV